MICPYRKKECKIELSEHYKYILCTGDYENCPLYLAILESQDTFEGRTEKEIRGLEQEVSDN